MRLAHAVLLSAVTVSPALAQRAPEIVIPGRPDIPVYINGIDASWGVVEGDFGLDRPDMVTPTVIYRPVTVALPSRVPGYHPETGKRPGYGRLEIVPPPAPTYYRSWSSGSAPGPVTEYPPYAPPTVVLSPNGNGQRHSKPRGSDPGHK